MGRFIRYHSWKVTSNHQAVNHSNWYSCIILIWHKHVNFPSSLKTSTNHLSDCLVQFPLLTVLFKLQIIALLLLSYWNTISKITQCHLAQKLAVRLDCHSETKLDVTLLEPYKALTAVRTIRTCVLMVYMAVIDSSKLLIENNVILSAVHMLKHSQTLYGAVLKTAHKCEIFLCQCNAAHTVLWTHKTQTSPRLKNVHTVICVSSSSFYK
jgi:hypothetical protein